MTVTSYTLLLFAAGILILLVTWLPLALRTMPLSLPILSVGLGYALYFSGLLDLDIRSLDHERVTEHLSETILLIALMGAGLRLDRPFGLWHWQSTWRLLFGAMPLTIAAMTLLMHYGVGLGWPSALLLAAALSPTDPVLAADVQSGPPGTGDHSETRFGLTSEAGLNDGLAFPFVTLAILLQSGTVSWGHWLAVDFALDLLLGAAIGWAGGWCMGKFMFHLPALKLSDTGEGLGAIGVALLCYATAAAVHGNGFVAVFVSALAIRSVSPRDEYHGAMSSFSEQIERVLVMCALVLFGWSLASGLLAQLTWAGAAAGLALLLVVRPAAAFVSLIGTRASWGSRSLMGFFGIRGIGTLFYMQYAYAQADFPDRRALWAIVAFAVLSSILVHGIASTPLMRRADARRRAAAVTSAET